ncbi:MarR family winged helix-turn-helix transcriptional regulator [uncultured Ruegeria sp.]|uniref:MarR family winged helix-turn-helix transcriptional regulator n=1 Tax=uncultured Ruegeria sp. TaxID=259304 RepID=UPI00260F7597|nr:MarR family winged helix-turn-helix transcriptional regulator [uncultured Ruegeria sp.]
MKRQHARIHPFLHSAAILEKKLESLLGSSGIRHRQALVLDALQKIGPSSQQHLVKHFSVSPGTMSSMISRLEALGYVQRETSPTDRRADVIKITPSGQSVLLGVAEVWEEGDKLIENILGSEDSKRLFALAEQLSRALGGGPPTIETPD